MTEHEERRDDMTRDGVRPAAARPRRPAQVHRPGLTIERVYTTAGVAPLRRGDLGAARRRPDQLEDGETIFEQHGVEFPDFWS